jgi:hypothetical protein
VARRLDLRARRLPDAPRQRHPLRPASVPGGLDGHTMDRQNGWERAGRKHAEEQSSLSTSLVTFQALLSRHPARRSDPLRLGRDDRAGRQEVPQIRQLLRQLLDFLQRPARVRLGEEGGCEQDVEEGGLDDGRH